MQWKPYRYDTPAESDGTELTLNGPEVLNGYILEATHMAIIDITTGNTVLKLGYIDLMGSFRTICQNQGTNLNMHQMRGKVYFSEGEAPAGRITTPTSGDDCFFSIHGRLWPIEESAPEDAEV